MERDDRIKWNVFQEKSTYRNDFRPLGSSEPPTRNQFLRLKTEPESKPSEKYVPRDLETFTPWKDSSKVPFNLYHEPKEIIGTIPSDKVIIPVIITIITTKFY